MGERKRKDAYIEAMRIEHIRVRTLNRLTGIAPERPDRSFKSTWNFGFNTIRPELSVNFKTIT
jgi:hypothetical protein